MLKKNCNAQDAETQIKSINRSDTTENIRSHFEEIKNKYKDCLNDKIFLQDNKENLPLAQYINDTYNNIILENSTILN